MHTGDTSCIDAHEFNKPVEPTQGMRSDTLMLRPQEIYSLAFKADK